MYRQRANSILNHITNTRTHTSGGRCGIRGGGDIMEVTAVEAMAVEAMAVEAHPQAVAGAEDVEDLDHIGDQLWG